MNTLSLKQIFFTLTFIIGFQVFGATVQQVKNDKVLISLQGTFVQVGDQFYGLTADKKKTSILEITTIKNDRAIAKIVKGSVKVNDTIEIKTKAGLANDKTPPMKSALKNPSFIRHDLKKISFNLRISSDVISTKQQDSQSLPQQETVDMSGINFGINVAVDLPLQDWYDVRGFAGYEMLSVKATGQYLSCDGKTSKDCNANINYLTFGGLGRLKYVKSNIVFWGGLGLGFKQPLTKKSTALTEENIAMANTAIVALGLDYHINNKYFVPFSFEYHKSFNESDTVPKINHNALLAGVGFMF